jgi:hypothetical protein
MALLSSSTTEPLGRLVNTYVYEYSDLPLTTQPDPNALRKVRVVVTTYDVVKSEYEAHIAPTKDESQKKQATKKKASTLSDDENSDDSAEHFGRTIKSKKSKSPKKSALFQVKWWRIVLGREPSACRILF